MYPPPHVCILFFYLLFLVLPVKEKYFQTITWIDEPGQIREFNLKKCVVNCSGQLVEKLAIPDKMFEEWKAVDPWDEIMKYWLHGYCGKYVVSWEGLCMLLKDIKKSDVAANLEKAIENSVNGKKKINNAYLK